MTTPVPPLPDHSTPQGAGDRMPIHVEENGQSLFAVTVLARDAQGNPIIDPQTGQYVTKDIIYTDPTSLHPGKYLLGIELNRILSLIASVVNVMQDVTAQCANKLQFFTKMQKVNTEQMNSVHVFVANNGDAWVSDPVTDSNTNTPRTELNSQQWAAQIQANNSFIANIAKSQQTSLNQFSQNIQDQTNTFTAMLQQFRSIVNQFRG